MNNKQGEGKFYFLSKICFIIKCVHIAWIGDADADETPTHLIESASLIEMHWSL